MEELLLPFPSPSPSGAARSPMSGPPVPGMPNSMSDDLSNPPFDPSFADMDAPPPVFSLPPDYLQAIESAWHQSQGYICGFTPDDIECLTTWQKSGVPVELVVQVIKEMTPRRQVGSVRGARRPRIYHLRYYHREVMRRWNPPSAASEPTLPRPKNFSRWGGQGGTSRRKPVEKSPNCSPSLAGSQMSLSPEKAEALRLELCTLLDEFAMALESAPRLWALRDISLPRTSAVCLRGSEFIRSCIATIRVQQRVSILDLERGLIALDQDIWQTLRDELPLSVIEDVLSGFAREELAAGRPHSRVSSNLVQLEREQRLRRWALRCHHLPLELTVADWWESSVLAIGGGASF